MSCRSHIGRRLAGIVAIALLAVAGSARAAAGPPDHAALEKQLADARARLDAAAREVAKLTGELYGGQQVDMFRALHGEPHGAMLGVNIGGPGERADGVEIAGVSPGGPAEAAGLKTGDVIVAVDDRELKRSDGRSPASQLVSYMRSVKPGQAVKVRYLRDGKHATADVKATAAEPMVAMMMGDHMMPMEMLKGMRLPGFHGMMLGEPGFGSLELVPVTAGLGRYFGTDKGLLVVRAPSEPGLGLTDGDVLMTIGGRIPESPGQAFRILQSYEPGDKVKLGILRDRKRMDVEATLPAAGRMHEHADPGAPPPLPPTPPGPPASPRPVPAPDKADSA
jgi:membrane-associated protease RseP (regulator of RpoE activity)